MAEYNKKYRNWGQILNKWRFLQLRTGVRPFGGKRRKWKPATMEKLVKDAINAETKFELNGLFQVYVI